MLANLYQWFWKDEYWLPPGYTWADMEDSSGVTYPHPRDLLATIPLAFIFVIIRYGFERNIGVLLSRVMGVRDYLRVKATPHPILESFFQTQNWNPKEAQLSHLASQCGLSVRQTQRWFRRRRNQERPNLTKKFCESSWRFFFYFSSFFGGILTIYNETWFWEPSRCFEGYPKQPLKTGIYWWYLLEISFYHSLLLTLPFDVKRKDTKEQVIHHFIVIFLMFLSHCYNLVYFGALVLLLHDISDILLEAGKMFHYAQWKHTCDILIILFAVVFIVSRLILFPNKIIQFAYYSTDWLKPFFGFYLIITLLMVLQGLHIFWSYFILRLIYSVVVSKKKTDVRSDLEEQDTSDEQSEMERQRNRRLQSKDDTDFCNLLQAREMGVPIDQWVHSSSTAWSRLRPADSPVEG